MEFTLVFNGTPLQFTAFVAGLEARGFAGLWFFGDHDAWPGREVNDLIVYERFGLQGCNAIGSVTAQTLRKDRALLIVQAADPEWPQLQPAWNQIADELARQKWIAVGAGFPAAPEGKRRPGPQRPEDDWARTQLHQGVSRATVRPEWEKRARANPKRENMSADSLDRQWRKLVNGSKEADDGGGKIGKIGKLRKV